MRRFSFVFLFLITSQIGWAQVEFDKERYVDLLRNGKYKQAYQELIEIQKKPHGKTMLTDFLIGKALCMSGHQAAANSRFNHILKNYRQLAPPIKDFVRSEMQSCQIQYDSDYWLAYNVIPVYPLPTAGVSGKLGKVYNCFQDYKKVEIVRNIAEDVFNSRIFSTNEMEEALQKVKEFLPENYVAASGKNFILVTHKSSKVSTAKRNEIFEDLEKTLAFYTSYFGLTPNDRVITTYLLPDVKSMQEIALKVHGMKIPAENYGYSLVQDYSILSISNFLGTGTLKHELFHLATRADIPDLPAWLDEGLATIYEESHWEGDELKGNKDFWRTEVLLGATQNFQFYSSLPDLPSFIESSWDDFDGTIQGNICQASLNYAYAKHFVFFLDSKDLLRQVIDSYRNRRFEDMDSEMLSNLQVVEGVIGSSLVSLEREFDLWLKGQYRFSVLEPIPNRGTSGIELHQISLVKEFKKQILRAGQISLKMREEGDTDLVQKLEAEITASREKYATALNSYNSTLKLTFSTVSRPRGDEIEFARATDELMSAISSLTNSLKQSIDQIESGA
ncbi:hypothetical protein C943_04309 [Mariniradius saccharolyticus AK6]|uniref:DUF1570 domain-containing protein n=1 Tax=Mariniradius saccharolyticus AK6 TaxID=1239962 RepID=M7Y8D1_9BACT|nr:hypothetical protein [Mariniradius saccharolyticus]EMS33431.1 hypothetical protein C943_04309 [Mariniradius saccharolyticus AK6]